MAVISNQLLPGETFHCSPYNDEKAYYNPSPEQWQRIMWTVLSVLAKQTRGKTSYPMDLGLRFLIDKKSNIIVWLADDAEHRHVYNELEKIYSRPQEFSTPGIVDLYPEFTNGKITKKNILDFKPKIYASNTQLSGKDFRKATQTPEQKAAIEHQNLLIQRRSTDKSFVFGGAVKAANDWISSNLKEHVSLISRAISALTGKAPIKTLNEARASLPTDGKEYTTNIYRPCMYNPTPSQMAKLVYTCMNDAAKISRRKDTPLFEPIHFRWLMDTKGNFFIWNYEDGHHQSTYNHLEDAFNLNMQDFAMPGVYSIPLKWERGHPLNPNAPEIFYMGTEPISGQRPEALHNHIKTFEAVKAKLNSPDSKFGNVRKMEKKWLETVAPKGVAEAKNYQQILEDIEAPRPPQEKTAYSLPNGDVAYYNPNDMQCYRLMKNDLLATKNGEAVSELRYIQDSRGNILLWHAKHGEHGDTLRMFRERLHLILDDFSLAGTLGVTVPKKNGHPIAAISGFHINKSHSPLTAAKNLENPKHLAVLKRDQFLIVHAEKNNHLDDGSIDYSELGEDQHFTFRNVIKALYYYYEQNKEQLKEEEIANTSGSELIANKELPLGKGKSLRRFGEFMNKVKTSVK